MFYLNENMRQSRVFCHQSWCTVFFHSTFECIVEDEFCATYFTGTHLHATELRWASVKPAGKLGKTLFKFRTPLAVRTLNAQNKMLFELPCFIISMRSRLLYLGLFTCSYYIWHGRFSFPWRIVHLVGLIALTHSTLFICCCKGSCRCR